ncbi:MAG: CBS domain-containing protein [Limnochordia bacterium]|jgi:predicted transcriptional regulator|nr:CBS domain-containing protein [Bacillota bacterium]NLH30969.1 CBS domain-containing protein [Bacillota bacterium]HOB08808.1 CBS domain-containing protein [Limnochordia bacterium]HQD69936.1 CBS domain-containing protein [Limnochordia bacterium]
MAGGYENSRRFLNAFVGIEQALGKIVRNKRHVPFYQLVDLAAKADPFIREIALELKEYGDLRNAIVHERIDDQPIAEPHMSVVERLEQIRDLLHSPPTVGDAFLGPVITCGFDDTLGSAITKMHANSFSKLPVYNGRQFVGILTAEAVTYWLADHMAADLDFTQVRVEAVLRYLHNPDNYRFVPPSCSLVTVLKLFEDFSHKGKRLQAVLISETGSESGALLGIITVFDLPRIYQVLEWKH